VHHPRVRPLLDDTGDDVALAALELAQDALVAEVAQALVDDLLRRERGDAAEVVRVVDALADLLACGRSRPAGSVCRRERAPAGRCASDRPSGWPLR
jgi:hypothetical protein